MSAFPLRILDAIDRDLLALLQSNARESVVGLSKQLHVARTTVIARLARLERENVIAGYGVRLGQETMDSGLQAFVGVSVEPHSTGDVLQRFATIREVELLCSVSGEFDYVAWLRAQTPSQLDALLEQIAAIEGVHHTTTSIVLARKIERLQSPLAEPAAAHAAGQAASMPGRSGNATAAAMAV
jgi:DNA-binding Lrp family transcriptional regulator